MAVNTPAEEPGDGEKPVDNDPAAAQRAVLDDPDLPAEDYMRASSDSAFLAELVEKRAAAGEGEPAPKGEGEGEQAAAGEGEGEGEGDGEAAAAGEGDGEGDGEGEGKGPKKRRRPGYKRRAEALLEQNDALKIERDELLRKLKTNGQPAAKSKAPAATPRPKMEDFEDEDAFLDALIDWRSEKKIETRMAERDQTQTRKDGEDNRRRQAVEAAKELDRQFGVAREAHEDYDAVLDSADDIEWSDRHAYAMMLTGVAGEIAYELGNNPEEAEKLAKITNPAKISMEMGKIVAKLEAAEAAKPPKEEDPKEEGQPKGAAAPKPPKRKNPKPMKNHIDGGAAPGVKDEVWWAEKSSPQEYLAREMDKRKALGR